MNISTYKIGDKICGPSSDGIVFDITDGGALLLIKLSQPTNKERNEFRSGRPQFRVAIANDIIFFLCKFGAGPWMDAPYYVYLGKIREYPDIILENEGLALHAMLIDAATGVLINQKLIGMPHDVTKSLLSAKNQPIIPDYDAVLCQTMQQYTTSDLLDFTV